MFHGVTAPVVNWGGGCNSPILLCKFYDKLIVIVKYYLMLLKKSNAFILE